MDEAGLNPADDPDRPPSNEATRTRSAGSGLTVSVVIPMFNAQAWIRETLTSVAGQTLAIEECLIVNDGSTDGSGRIVEEVIEGSDFPFRLLETSNMGVAKARNRGIEESTGNLIAFLDADDLWLPQKLECQVDLISNSGADMCICGYEMFDGATGKSIGIVTTRDPSKALGRWITLEGNGWLPSSTAIVTRELLAKLSGFNPDFRITADLEFAWRASKVGTMVSCPEVLVGYRIHPTQMSRQERAKPVRQLYDLILSDHQDEHFARRCQANLDAHVGYNYLVQGRLRAGLDLLWKVARRDWIRLLTLPMWALARRVVRRYRSVFHGSTYLA